MRSRGVWRWEDAGEGCCSDIRRCCKGTLLQKVSGSSGVAQILGFLRDVEICVIQHLTVHFESLAWNNGCLKGKPNCRPGPSCDRSWASITPGEKISHCGMANAGMDGRLAGRLRSVATVDTGRSI